MKKYRLYLLDFDGTIIDSFQGLKIFYRETFGSIGVSISEEDCFLFTKMSLQEAYKRKVVDDSPEKVERFLNKCDEVVASGILLEHNVPFYDTLPFINFLKENHLPNGIVTGNETTHVQMVLNNCGINDFYDFVIGSRELICQKPHPEGILRAIKKAGFTGDYKDVCYVGDSYNDYIAAKRAGITPILVNRHQEFTKNEEYVLIDSLNELIS